MKENEITYKTELEEIGFIVDDNMNPDEILKFEREWRIEKKPIVHRFKGHNSFISVRDGEVEMWGELGGGIFPNIESCFMYAKQAVDLLVLKRTFDKDKYSIFCQYNTIDERE